jgi:hypothetical protein
MSGNDVHPYAENFFKTYIETKADIIAALDAVHEINPTTFRITTKKAGDCPEGTFLPEHMDPTKANCNPAWKPKDDTMEAKKAAGERLLIDTCFVGTLKGGYRVLLHKKYKDETRSKRASSRDSKNQFSDYQLVTEKRLKYIYPERPPDFNPLTYDRNKHNFAIHRVKNPYPETAGTHETFEYPNCDIRQIVAWCGLKVPPKPKAKKEGEPAIVQEDNEDPEPATKAKESPEKNIAAYFPLPAASKGVTARQKRAGDATALTTATSDVLEGAEKALELDRDRQRVALGEPSGIGAALNWPATTDAATVTDIRPNQQQLQFWTEGAGARPLDLKGVEKTIADLVAKGQEATLTFDQQVQLCVSLVYANSPWHCTNEALSKLLAATNTKLSAENRQELMELLTKLPDVNPTNELFEQAFVELFNGVALSTAFQKICPIKKPSQ